MNIQREDGKTVVIRAPLHKAQDLLGGLIAHHDEFGDLAAELERQLRAAGVEPVPPPDHMRYEYMPPLRH